MSLTSTDTVTSSTPQSSMTEIQSNWWQVRISNRFKPFIDAPILADFSSNREVEVIIVDSGIDRTHVELAGVSIDDLYFVPGFGSTADDMGHGTAMASLIVGNTIGIAKHAKIKVVKITGKNYQTDAGDIYAALDAILAYHMTCPSIVKIVSNSWQVPADAVIADKIKSMMDAGMIVLAASGNVVENIDDIAPAGIPGVLAVAASTTTDTNAVNLYGVNKQIDIYAPGMDVWVPDVMTSDSSYSYAGGSSVACAITAGVVAIIAGMTAAAPVAADVISALKKDATQGALTLPTSQATSTNRLLHHPASTEIIPNQDYYIGEIHLPTAEPLIVDINQIMQIDQFAYAFGDFAFEFISDDAATQAVLNNLRFEYSHAIVDFSGKGFELPADEAVCEYSFKIAASYEGSIKYTSPTIYFFVIGPTAAPAVINQAIADLQQKNSLTPLIPLLLTPIK